MIDRNPTLAEATRWRHRLATSNAAFGAGVVLLVLAVAYVPIAVAANAPTQGIPGSTVIEALVFATLGLLLARRRPSSAVGWILMGAGLILLFIADGSQYSVLDYRNHGGQWPLGPLAELCNLAWIPGILLIPLGVLYFPDGALPSPRWRVAVRAYVAIGAAFVLGFYAVAIGDLTAPHLTVAADTGDIAEFANPTGGLGVLYLAWATLVSVGSLAAVVGLAINYRRSKAERRQQLKWFALGAGIFLLAGLPTVVLPLNLFGSSAAGSILFDITSLVPPITIAVAILKYRLYDVDLVISRTLVYAALAAFITAVYVGIAVGIGSLVGSGGKPNLGLSILATAIVAVGFQPVRERLQRAANRLVYGRRATPYEVLSQFSERVAESYAVEDVLPRMARVLAEGTGAQRADVWLRSGEWLRAAAAWPADLPPQNAIRLNGSGLAVPDGTDRMIAVRHQGDVLGALSVIKRAGEALTPVEENLLTHLAGQAGLVLKNVGLTGALHARLDELRASRQRLVTAQDQERRRLERNLHDGAQQHLVALKVKLGLAEMLMQRDPKTAAATLLQLKLDADEALETLRDLARGIYPPLLADKGLTAAIESQARKATVAVRVEADSVGRYSQEIEATVYFCVLEALQNVQKYAEATAACVSLRGATAFVEFEVSDDGLGFDAGATHRGTGLSNMADRIDATGGTLDIVAAPGAGTRVKGRLPLEAGAAARGSAK